MGIYINKGNNGFRLARNGEYVDKSGLIAVVNKILDTEKRFVCVSRSRRFGKSMAAGMLNAYYDQSCNSRSLFADLEIARDASFEQHLNKYPVIYLDMTAFVTRYKDEDILQQIEAKLKADALKEFPEVTQEDGDDFMDILVKAGTNGRRFIFIIDEWDAICREFDPHTAKMDRYVNWLRRMFKDVSAEIFAVVYMTGILPIKKYKTESALNNFQEYSMVEPRNMARYFGFTIDEVRALAEKNSMDLEELRKWYDGYKIGDEPSMFNPNSVMQALNAGRCNSFWATTGAYDAVVTYIQMNYDGLKDDILLMLAGGRCKVNTTKFRNDISAIQSRDDVLTVLIHLGYLSFDWQSRECYVPNYEVSMELSNAVEDANWQNVARALQQSEQLLCDTLDGNEEAVAKGIETAHDENTSILSYNNENSLACVLSIAYYAARNNYIVHREYASGKGFADLVLIPRKNVNSPAIILELKCNTRTTRAKSRQVVQSAIDQIRRKDYPAKVAQYASNLLLVAISYDKRLKKHRCRIEKA